MPSPAAPARDVEVLGQVFTPDAMVDRMLALVRNRGRVLEPSCGDGQFSRRFPGCVAIEVDGRVRPAGALDLDFFAFPETERFATVIGNPPFVRNRDIRPETRALLDDPLFDNRANLYMHFIAKCVRHLEPGGELIFINPRDFIKATASRRLNEFLLREGTITHFCDLGDEPVFPGYTPNCAIWRFVRGDASRRLDDGRLFDVRGGQILFLPPASPAGVRLGDLLTVKVGAVSGADRVFADAVNGTAEFVCSRTRDDGSLRRMIPDAEVPHPALLAHKQSLIARRVRRFDESNWWRWGRLHHRSQGPRIYVNAKTRRDNPFYVHDCPDYDGSVLALFPRRSGLDLERLTGMLNGVDWSGLGFRCGGRFLFSPAALEEVLLPAEFATFLSGEPAGAARQDDPAALAA